MTAQQGPAGPRRRLGAELRRLRLKADMTLDDVAELMTCSTSKISRLETGKGIPKLPDVNELIRIYAVRSEAEIDMLRRLVREGRTQGWWEPITENVHPERFVLDAPARFAALETEAVEVRTFDTSLPIGILQTERYARTVMRGLLPDHAEIEIEKLVQLRMQRAQALHRDPEPLRLRAVLDESVFARAVGGPDVMAEQLEHFLALGELANVTLQVFPFTAGMHRALAGQFTVLAFADSVAGDVVHIEGSAGDTYLEAASDVDLYNGVFTDVSGVSLPPGESADLIGQYRARITAREGRS